MKNYLRETKLLDYHDNAIQDLVQSQGWSGLPTFQKIEQIYNYVKDVIRFGYNVDDATPATQVLYDGYGQCNTKTILVMALLRAVEIPCRFHGFTLDKQVQSGILGVLYRFSPTKIIHTWAEVYYDGQWFPLEGLILDRVYLENIQRRFQDYNGTFCGWGVGTTDLQNPAVEWQGSGTYIQKEGIVGDLGIYPTPDEFYASNRQRLSPVKRFLYQSLGRRYMNWNVTRVRNGV